MHLICVKQNNNFSCKTFSNSSILTTCTDYNIRSVELYANLTACIMRLHQLLHSAAPRAINSVRLAYITPLLTYLTATY